MFINSPLTCSNIKEKSVTAETVHNSDYIRRVKCTSNLQSTIFFPLIILKMDARFSIQVLSHMIILISNIYAIFSIFMYRPKPTQTSNTYDTPLPAKQLNSAFRYSSSLRSFNTII